MSEEQVGNGVQKLETVEMMGPAGRVTVNKADVERHEQNDGYRQLTAEEAATPEAAAPGDTGGDGA